jgi:hypothetical protein
MTSDLDEVPYDPARKRYYLFSEDLARNPSDFEELNASDIYPKSPPGPNGRGLVRAGARRDKPAGAPFEISYGLPEFLAKPKVRIGIARKPLDAYGFHRRRLVSTRAKGLLSEIDPGAFDFAECETVTPRGLQLEPYWWMDIARVVDRFDENRSEFETYEDVDPGFEHYHPRQIRALHDIHMSPDVPRHFHAFILARAPLRMVFDDVLADAWRERGFTGAAFVPLQPPAPRERKGRG